MNYRLGILACVAGAVAGCGQQYRHLPGWKSAAEPLGNDDLTWALTYRESIPRRGSWMPPVSGQGTRIDYEGRLYVIPNAEKLAQLAGPAYAAVRAVGGAPGLAATLWLCRVFAGIVPMLAFSLVTASGTWPCGTNIFAPGS